jgi:diaminopimelate epimerase
VILDFVKLSPAENTTVLVTNYIHPCYYQSAAKDIMSYSHLNAEQVGFITEPQHKNSVIRLEMAGGEFCGNGVLAAGALSKYLGLTKGDVFKIESSGSDELLECHVKKLEDRVFSVKSTMPVDYKHKEYRLFTENMGIDGFLAEFKGITHFVFELKTNINKQLLEKLVKNLSGKISADAVGIIPYTRRNDYVFIKPCVYVQKTGSLVFERGCGSGTLALGLCIAHRNKENTQLMVKQPGGSISVTISGAKKSGKEVFRVEKAFIQTDVEITCEGKVFV